MRFEETPIPGVLVIEIAPITDDRGFFARTWCRDEFSDAGLDIRWAQSNLGVSTHALTLRGLHFQRAPHEEYKLVRCTRGSVFDVAVDLRIGSPTYLQSVTRELSDVEQQGLLVPPGCAHGYLTLEDRTHLEYLTSEPYVREVVAGVRYDDPRLAIAWPANPQSISQQDLGWPAWTDEAASRIVPQLKGRPRSAS